MRNWLNKQSWTLEGPLGFQRKTLRCTTCKTHRKSALLKNSVVVSLNELPKMQIRTANGKERYFQNLLMCKLFWDQLFLKNNLLGLLRKALTTPTPLPSLFLKSVDTDDIRVHTSDIRKTYKTYECIRVTYVWHVSTYEWHTSTYKWHTNDIRVRRSDIRMTYGYIRVTHHYIRVHKSDTQITYEYIPVTYKWHTSTKCKVIFWQSKF